MELNPGQVWLLQFLCRNSFLTGRQFPIMTVERPGDTMPTCVPTKPLHDAGYMTSREFGDGDSYVQSITVDGRLALLDWASQGIDQLVE